MKKFGKGEYGIGKYNAPSSLKEFTRGGGKLKYFLYTMNGVGRASIAEEGDIDEQVKMVEVCNEITNNDDKKLH